MGVISMHGTRKDFGVEVAPVYGWVGFSRYIHGYVAKYYGAQSEVFPRRGMAESWVRANFRGHRMDR
jgi:hypothetical protein